MSACKANSAFEGENASFMAVLLVNCTFTALIALAPTFFASTEVSLPFALMLRRNEPRSPRRTLLPFCKASHLVLQRVKHGLHIGTRHDAALYDLRKRHQRCQCHLLILFHTIFYRVVLCPDYVFNHNVPCFRWNNMQNYVFC